jgi:hypothetical protein
MTGTNNALLQLALMLRGNPALGGGIGENWSGPVNPYPGRSAPPFMNSMVNSWAAMPGPHHGGPDGHLPITPAQAYLLLDPEFELPPLGRTISPPKPWFQPPEAVPSPYPTDLPPIAVPHDPFFESPRQWKPRFDQDEMDEENWPIPGDDDPCKAEVEAAINFCRKEIRLVKRGQSSGNQGVTFRQCMRGQLSAACGGNPTAQMGSAKTFS